MERDRPNSEVHVCDTCSSAILIGARFCSQCGAQLHADSRSSLAETPLHQILAPQRHQLVEDASPGLTLDTPMSDLLSVMRAGSVAEQEEALVLILRRCMFKRQRELLYDADGLAAMIEAVKHGRTHFIQACALGCVRWANVFDSKLNDAEFQELKKLVRAVTHQEAISILDSLQKGNNHQKLAALIYCVCMVATIDYEELYYAGVVPELADVMKDGDEDQKLWAADGLGYICAAPGGCGALVCAEVGSNILAVFESGSKVLKEWVMKGLTTFEGGCSMILDTGGISVLVESVRSGQDTVKLYATEVLGNLTATSEPCRRAVITEQAVAPLMELFRCGTERQQDEAARVLANLASDDTSRAEIECEKVVQHFVARLQTGTDSQKDQAAEVLARLTFITENCCTVARAGAISPFVKLLRNRTDDQKFQASRALANLVANVRNHVPITQKGAVPLLTAFVRNASIHTTKKDFAVCALSILAATGSDDPRVMVPIEGVIPVFVHLLRKGNACQKNHAIRGLGYFAANVRRRQALRDAGALNRLIDLLSLGTRQQREGAVHALAYLAADPRVGRAIDDGRGVPNLVKILRTGGDQAKADSACILAHIASDYPRSRAHLRESGAVVLLEALSRTGGTQLLKRNAETALKHIEQDAQAPPKRPRQNNYTFCRPLLG